MNQATKTPSNDICLTDLSNKFWIKKIYIYFIHCADTNNNRYKLEQYSKKTMGYNVSIKNHQIKTVCHKMKWGVN